MNTTLKCACLVATDNNALLAVRVRNNTHWYLPGGKIDSGETPAEALSRELQEELGMAVLPGSIEYLYTVTGPAYGQAGEVELVCFSAQWAGDFAASAEISEAAWISLDRQELLAPAVQILCRDYLGLPQSQA
jgi:8-oxo-dGTP pyrophosphatase MutT (NUDIX family)